MQLSVSIATVSADDGHLHMKEKLEVIRNQLGPSWLQSLEIHQSSANENSEKPLPGTGDMMSSHTTETTQTSDSITQVATDFSSSFDTGTQMCHLFNNNILYFVWRHIQCCCNSQYIKIRKKERLQFKKN